MVNVDSNIMEKKKTKNSMQWFIEYGFFICIHLSIKYTLLETRKFKNYKYIYKYKI